MLAPRRTSRQELHVYHHFDDEALQCLARLFTQEIRKMSAETQAAIDELKNEVTPLTDAVTAVAAVIDGLVARLEEAGDDPAEIREVIAGMKANRDALAAAALKGTGSAPAPTE